MRRCLTLLGLVAVSLAAEEVAVPKVVGGGQVSEVYWVRLEKGDLMLESLQKFIDDRKIREGSVLWAVGGLETCTFHGVNNTMTTVNEPIELLHLAGPIADGKPHFHIVVSNKARGAFGGHLEAGCKVLSKIEVGIAKFGGAFTKK